jgi:hypothetical protein
MFTDGFFISRSASMAHQFSRASLYGNLAALSATATKSRGSNSVSGASSSATAP